MNALVSIKRFNEAEGKLTSKILSGGDEKVLRLFEAPYNYIKTMNSLNPHLATTDRLIFDLNHSNEEVENLIESEAKKQPLGLMNKPAVLLANKGNRVDEELEGGVGTEFDPVTVLSNKNKDKELLQSITEPPVEDILMARTLWPEQQKLYGHVFEVFCIAASHRGDVAASACKAKETKYADIIIWDLTKGQTTVPACRLAGHKLTVVQLEFTKDD